MPERIQQRRTKGWRLPLGAKSVARPSKWGNPFRMIWSDCEQGGMCWTVTDGKDLTIRHINDQITAAKRAVELFTIHTGVFGAYEVEPGAYDELRGLDLACWCPLDQPCHADVLLEIANA